MLTIKKEDVLTVLSYSDWKTASKILDDLIALRKITPVTSQREFQLKSINLQLLRLHECGVIAKQKRISKDTLQIQNEYKLVAQALRSKIDFSQFRTVSFGSAFSPQPA